MIGAFFLATGLLAIAAHKISLGKTLFPVSLHALCGVLAVLGVCVQVVVGMEKIEMMQRTNSAVRIRRWHGLAGGVTWDLLVLTVVLGMLEFLESSPLTTASMTLVVIVWVTAHVQLKIASSESASGAVGLSDYTSSGGAGGSSSSSGSSGTGVLTAGALDAASSNFASTTSSNSSGTGTSISSSISGGVGAVTDIESHGATSRVAM